ncbi:MAG: hypothetical protein ACJATT_002092, partial [Myxococcota bacterium]
TRKLAAKLGVPKRRVRHQRGGPLLYVEELQPCTPVTVVDEAA